MTASGEAHCDLLPSWIRVQPAVDVVLQGNGQPVHEGCAWCDCVAVKDVRLVLHRDVDSLLGKLLPQLLLLLLLCHTNKLAEWMCGMLEWMTMLKHMHRAPGTTHDDIVGFLRLYKSCNRHSIQC